MQDKNSPVCEIFGYFQGELVSKVGMTVGWAGRFKEYSACSQLKSRPTAAGLFPYNASTILIIMRELARKMVLHRQIPRTGVVVDHRTNGHMEQKSILGCFLAQIHVPVGDRSHCHLRRSGVADHMHGGSAPMSRQGSSTLTVRSTHRLYNNSNL